MTSSPPASSTSTKNTVVAGALSLVIPGAGQVYAGRLWRGAAILFTTLLLAFLVNWALVNFHIGEMAIGARRNSR